MSTDPATAMKFETGQVRKLSRDAGSANFPMLNSEEIFQLQLEQREHDDLYHPEISRLSMDRRLTHMALHFAKYAGRIADAVGTGEERDVDRTLIDTFIIALSSANILNVNLGHCLGCNSTKEVTDDAGSLSNGRAAISISELLTRLTSASGKMAKACEAIDHLEPIPFREEIESAVIELAQIAERYAQLRTLDLRDGVRTRLKGVREKRIFHGHL